MPRHSCSGSGYQRRTGSGKLLSSLLFSSLVPDTALPGTALLHITQTIYHSNSPSVLTGDCEGVRGAIPQLSWVLGEPGGLGTGDLSGLEPVGERDQVTPEHSGKQEPKSGIRVLSVLTEPG